MPNRKFSTILSLAASFIVAAVLAALLFCGPTLFSMYIKIRVPGIPEGDLKDLVRVFSWVLYPCIVLGAAAIFCLIKLLFNIMKDKTFLQANVLYLRVISWCCIGAAAITFVGMFFYLPFVFATVAAGFVGLMLHVVKNVMQSAAELKEDNDLTI